jgi:hypothetical protein
LINDYINEAHRYRDSFHVGPVRRQKQEGRRGWRWTGAPRYRPEVRLNSNGAHSTLVTKTPDGLDGEAESTYGEWGDACGFWSTPALLALGRGKGICVRHERSWAL